MKNTLKRLFIAGALLGCSFLGAKAQVSITTWGVDLSHSGNNSNETILTPANVSATGSFGELFTQTTDGQTYGQPLVAAGVNVGGTTHNIVYVATEHDSLYAFDADSNTGANAGVIWHDSFIPANTTTVPQADVGSGDITVELGITTTPVIDTASSTIYIVSKVKTTATRTDSTGTYGPNTYQQYLHALDLATGAEKFGGPVLIHPTFAGSSNYHFPANYPVVAQQNTYEQSGTTSATPTGVIPFNALQEHARSAMILYNGIVYISYASHSDTNPYHGLIIGYNATTLAFTRSFIDTPNGTQGGFWGGGAGPAIDPTTGYMYIMSANGVFDQTSSPYTTATDWSESFLKLSTTGTGPFTASFSDPTTYFTPSNWNTLNGNDWDIGSGGVCLIPNQAGPHPHIMVGGGKGHVLYVIDRDSLGGYSTTADNVIQEIPEQGGDWIFTTPAYFNGYIYYAPSGGPLEQRAVGYNSTTGTYIADPPTFVSTDTYAVKGSGCFISSNGTANGIVWLVNGSLRAYDATNVSANAGKPIYTFNVPNSTAKFQLPTVVNGKAYVTAFSNTTNVGTLHVLGILQVVTAPPTAASNLVATAANSTQINLTWTDNSNNESGFKVERATSAAGPFTVVTTTANNVTSFSDTNLTPATTYYYEIVATNAKGDAAASNVANAKTLTLYIANGLVGYWPFDENTGLVANDVTGNGHTGTINGEVNWAAGEINSALNFHGTGTAESAVTIPNTASMQYTATQSFTVSEWVNPSNVHNVEQCLLSKSADQGNKFGLYINAANQFVFRGPTSDVVGGTATTGTWTHVAGVQDGAAGTRKLYINGVLVATGTAQAADGAGDLWIAQQNLIPSNPESYPGAVDEVRLYNRALSATEITTLLGPPILQGLSVQTHGGTGTYGLSITPSLKVVTEPRKGSTSGNYSLVLSFSAPVSGITATLGLQGGGTAVGAVGTITYDSTGAVVTVPLTGVGNAQALNLHLSGIVPGNGTADIPFNVLWGDVNYNNYVDYLDASVALHSQGTAVSNTTYLCDVNCDGAINATDTSLVTAGAGTNVGTQTAVNLAAFQPASDTTNNGGGTGASAAGDNNSNTRWESVHVAGTQWIAVDLGSSSTISGINLDWETAGAAEFELQWSNTNNGTDWTDFVNPANSQPWHVTGNTTPAVHNPQSFAVVSQSARYVRVLCEVRTTAYGYSLWDFQVIGIPGSHTANPAPSVTGDLTKSGAVGTALTAYTITASNTPTSFSATGLPPGLTISTAGAVTGTPTAGGTFTSFVTATNGSGSSAPTPVVFTITGGGSGAPVVSATPAPPAGTANTAYAGYQVTASNTPTSYAVASGALPTGLSLNTTTGFISGTPTVVGTSTFGITASNASGTSPAVSFSITIAAGGSAPVVSATPAPPAGTANTAYAGYQITATNSPTSYAVASGALPTGLSLNTTSGLISGTPTVAGTSTFGITATNSFGTSPAVSFSITINASGGTAPVVSATPAPPAGTVNTAYAGYQVTATNSPTSYAVASGALPTGLSLNTASGLISGTPTVAGTSTFGITASNASGTSPAVSFSITINAAGGNTPVISTTTPPAGLQNGYYSYQLAASNNPTSYAVTTGTLPLGLTINAAGLISGTPTGSGATTFSVTATNANGAGTPASMTITLAANTDTNLAATTGVTATSSSPGTDLNSASLAIDNNFGSRWETVQGATADPSTITIDLQQVYAISAIDIDWETASAQNYTIQVSTTGVAGSYTQIKNITNNPAGGGMNLFTGLGTSARFIQLTGTTRTTIYGYSIWEFQIFGHAVSGGAPVVSATPAPPAGTVNTAYAGYQVTATNSPTSYAVASGALPTGLSLNLTTGLISGTPTVAGTSTFGITATNASGTSPAVSFSITVSAAGDTNVGLSKTATASSFQAGNVVANANDGSTTTRWAASDGTVPQWWMVDLGSNKTLSRVDINWYLNTARYSQYIIETSTDNVTFTKVVDKSTNTTVGPTSDSFTATARYVRVTVSKVSTGFVSAYEIGVYGH